MDSDEELVLIHNEQGARELGDHDEDELKLSVGHVSELGR